MNIVVIDPNTNAADKVLFYERTRRVMIAKTIIGVLKDAAIMTLSLNKKHWTWMVMKKLRSSPLGPRLRY